MSRDVLDAVTGRVLLRWVVSSVRMPRHGLFDHGRVVVDLDGLAVGRTSCVTIFPAVLTQCGGWPSAKIALCRPDPGIAQALAAPRELQETAQFVVSELVANAVETRVHRCRLDLGTWPARAAGSRAGCLPGRVPRTGAALDRPAGPGAWSGTGTGEEPHHGMGCRRSARRQHRVG